MNPPTLHETFHSPGVIAELTWDGWRCRLEIRVDAAGSPAATPLKCDLLLQPLDARGLAHGPVARLATEEVLLRPTADGTSWLGRLWLPPGIDFPLARNCYYRLAKMC